MESIISDREIEAYAYKDRSDIEKLIISDSVRTVKEGAFYNCTGLKHITVGRNVEEIREAAFEGIPKRGSLIWLPAISYKPLTFRVFRDMGSFAEICAPYLPFYNGTLYERTALAAGFILHPEYEDEYSDELREEYLCYIREGLSSDAGKLADAGVLEETVRCVLRRKLINRKRSLEEFVSRAMEAASGDEKEAIRRMAKEERLQCGRDIEEIPEDRNKKQLRFLYYNTNRSEQQFFLDNGDIPAELPEVLYKDGTPAPPELLRFIMFRYMNQWAFIVRPVPEFIYDEDADRFASELDTESLRSALSQMLPVVVPASEIKHPDMNKSEFGVIHIQRLIPYLRYATQEMADDCRKRSERFLDYEKYGLSGQKTYRTYQSALFLCEGEKVPIEALRRGKLTAYAYLKKTDFPHIISFVEKSIYRLEEKGAGDMDLSNEKEMIKKEVEDFLYDLYTSGNTMRYPDLIWTCAESSFFRDAAESLLWKNINSGEYFRILSDEIKSGMVKGDSFVTPAHTCEMELEEILYWKERIDPVFDQLWIAPERYLPENPEKWTLKYKGIKTSEKELKKLTGRGFELWMNNDRGYSVYFYGKCYIHGTADNNGAITLETISESPFRPRELNEALHIIDTLLYDRLVGYGKVPAQYFIDRFDEKTTERVLDMAIANSAHENVAALLEYKKTFVKGNSDLDL